MPKVKKNPLDSSRKSPPARTPEAREDQLISLAVDLAEQQLRDGTASSMVITHYLKLGSSKEKLERKMLETQMRNLEAKTEAIESAKRMDEMYTKAIEAMRTYAGASSDEDVELYNE
jgi:hypothetical protein